MMAQSCGQWGRSAGALLGEVVVGLGGALERLREAEQGLGGGAPAPQGNQIPSRGAGCDELARGS